MTAKKNLTNAAKLELLPPAIADTLKEKAKMTSDAEKPTPAETADETPKAAKSKMTWAEKMASLPEEEAKAARAKAAEASRRSKAKRKGTSPEQASVDRIQAKLTKIADEQTQLNTRRQDLEEQLEAAMAELKEAQAVEELTKKTEAEKAAADKKTKAAADKKVKAAESEANDGAA
jgi:hypothetical protein